MSTQHATMHVTGVGCWLPSVSLNYFRPYDERDDVRAGDMDLVQGEKRYYALPSIPGNPTILQLDCSVYRRLFSTLNHWGYSTVFPAYGERRGKIVTLNGALFVTDDLTSPATAVDRPIDAANDTAKTVASSSVEEWRELGVSRLILATDLEGFYVLTALHSQRNSGTDKLQERLWQHLRGLGGGDHSSHENSATEEYRTKPSGMLTFSQLNVIMEGLFNSTLDFEVFFSGKVDDSDKDAKEARVKYTLGAFIETVSTVALEGSHLAATSPVTKMIDGLNKLLQRDEGASAAVTANEVLPTIIDHEAKSRIIKAFLGATTTLTLRPLKERIERCRRALLASMIQVTHRRDRLVQLDSPPLNKDPLEGVNEDQLRGYLLLLAAKLPLVSGVQIHLEELEKSITSSSTQLHIEITAWSLLLRSIYADTQGMNIAMNQAWSDRMLDEEEQIHIEEETLAEIERIRKQTAQNLSPLSGISASALSNIFALAAVVFAGLSVLKVGLPAPSYKDPWTLQNAELLGEIVGVALFLAGVYGVMHVAFMLLARLWHWLIRRFRGKDHSHAEPYFYELDVHLEAPIDAAEAQSIMAADFSGPAVPGQPQSDRFKKPRRSNYRIERTSKDEAAHKVYIETDLFLSPGGRWIRKGKLHAVLVYELLFHRPSQEHSYVFEDVRVVATSEKRLEIDQIKTMKEIIAREFVNRWIKGTDDQIQAEKIKGRPIDALMSLNIIEDSNPQQAGPAAQGLPTLSAHS
jgi:hypothetical protein